MLSQKEQEILYALEKSPHAATVEVVTVEIVGAKHSPTLRIYIDTPEGVSFDQLSRAQSWINEVIDELDPFSGTFMLEVSSPGVDRPLRTFEHFVQATGEQLIIQLANPISGTKKVRGVLKSCNTDEQSILVASDQGDVTIPLSAIKKAHIKAAIQF